MKTYLVVIGEKMWKIKAESVDSRHVTTDGNLIHITEFFAEGRVVARFCNLPGWWEEEAWIDTRTPAVV